MITINNLEQMKPYYDEGTNTYIFYDDIEFTFSLNINANINAFDIKAVDIKANDIIALNIKADYIKACDIKVRDIDACVIDAKSISYFAFCIAYESLRCKSIKGKRRNSFHKCLDTEIEFIKEEEEWKSFI